MSFVRVYVLGWLVALAGCAATRIEVPPPSGEVVTVLVPGYYGSFLATDGDASERAWVTTGQLLSRGERSLALPFPGQRPSPSYGPLHPDGLLTRVGPPLLATDAYATTLEFGREHLPDLVPFAYDWRQDIRVSAGQLCARIEQLVAQGGGRRTVNIVAHSMGGLVTLHCLLHGGAGGRPWAAAEHVRRVVFVGTPLGGSPVVFDDLLGGTRMGRNRALLSAEALFSFPASFQLLPSGDDFLEGGPAGGGAWEVFNPVLWRTQRWGPFADLPANDDAAYTAQLARLKQAHGELRASLKPNTAPPFALLLVVGTGRDTVRGFRGRGTLDVEHPLLADGDGSVLASNAIPPTDWVLPYQRFFSTAEHVALVSDEQVLQEIARFLR